MPGPETEARRGDMRFEAFGTEFQRPAAEDAILRFWREQDIFRKSLALREHGPRFVFYEGPPTANGLPGIHHALARTLKDLVCRYQTMRGHYVARKSGWDTHGLPVEIEVEKSLGFRSKSEIREYGVDRFIRKCRESVFHYEGEWRRFTERIGYWLDLDDAYVTCTNGYIESVWWGVKKFWDAGLLSRGHRIQPYCPRCGTPLSSHEVSQGFDDADDPSVVVRFRVAPGEKAGAGGGVSFLVWTTTPWTLLSNAALAVGAGIAYVTVRQGAERFILARERLAALEGPYEIEGETRGSDLAGARYEPLFPFLAAGQPDAAFRVHTADFVSVEDGTGIVHVAPAFGEDDYVLGTKAGLPLLQPVDESGRFTEPVTPWLGRFVKDADPEILGDLEARGLLYSSGRITHTYPFCYRCDTPLLYYARGGWMIRTTQYRDALQRANAGIEWFPPEIGEHRFGNWLENNVDWLLSRERYWGTPLPIWVCGACGANECVGSVEDLRAKALNFASVVARDEDLDLHKPQMDAIELRCPKCGGAMRRTPEVLDAWFDSGSMPYAQWHYPFENAGRFEESFPADFIAEGVDQTRGWFYSMLAISTFLSGRSSYRRCLVNELVLNDDGQKMSKSRGTAVNPIAVLDRFGADALRWYLVSTSPPWVPTRYADRGVAEVEKKLIGTLLNTCNFFATYANIDAYDPAAEGLEGAALTDMDRWALSRLHGLVASVREAMDRYDPTRAARAIQTFLIEDLSNWYVRRSRRRFWRSGGRDDKRAAYATLHAALAATARLMAPLAPFVAEEVHRKLVAGRGGAPESVHLCDFPEPDASRVDARLEEEMAAAQRLVALGRAARMEAKVRVRQPLARLLVLGRDPVIAAAASRFADQIRDELNVKDVEVVGDAGALLALRARPNYRALGPRFGPRAKAVAERLAALTPGEIGTLREKGALTLMLDGGPADICGDDLDVAEAPREGLVTARDGADLVALDVRLDEALLREGRAREIVHRIQTMRKSAGMQVTDRVHLYCELPPVQEAAVRAHEAYVAGEALAETMEFAYREAEYSECFALEGETVRISLARASGGGAREGGPGGRRLEGGTGE
jgi:isoleucyl-tRNA synthetase